MTPVLAYCALFSGLCCLIALLLALRYFRNRLTLLIAEIDRLESQNDLLFSVAWRLHTKHNPASSQDYAMAAE